MGLTETDVDHITQTRGGKKGGKDREIDECSWKAVGGISIKAFWLRLAVEKVVQGPLLCLMRYNEVCVVDEHGSNSDGGLGLQSNLLDLQGSDAWTRGRAAHTCLFGRC